MATRRSSAPPTSSSCQDPPSAPWLVANPLANPPSQDIDLALSLSWLMPGRGKTRSSAACGQPPLSPSSPSAPSPALNSSRIGKKKRPSTSFEKRLPRSKSPFSKRKRRAC